MVLLLFQFEIKIAAQAALILRRINFILKPLKLFSGNLEGWKVKIFFSAGTMTTILTLAN